MRYINSEKVYQVNLDYIDWSKDNHTHYMRAGEVYGILSKVVLYRGIGSALLKEMETGKNDLGENIRNNYFSIGVEGDDFRIKIRFNDSCFQKDYSGILKNGLRVLDNEYITICENEGHIKQILRNNTLNKILNE